MVSFLPFDSHDYNQQRNPHRLNNHPNDSVNENLHSVSEKMPSRELRNTTLKLRNAALTLLSGTLVFRKKNDRLRTTDTCFVNPASRPLTENWCIESAFSVI